jgi:hypothetical protein
MAIGTTNHGWRGVKIDPRGVVRKRYAEVGDYVRRARLLEISPNPTPLELIELRRASNAGDRPQDLQRELDRQAELRSRNLNSDSDRRAGQRRVDESTVHSRSRETAGPAGEAGGRRVGARSRPSSGSPIDGFVLEDSIEIGDPVVASHPTRRARCSCAWRR